MLNVTVEYTAHLRQAAGIPCEQIDLEPGCTAGELAQRLAERHGEPLRRLILDAEGRLNPTVLVFAGGVQVRDGAPLPLRDGEVVTLLAPISGG